MSEKRPTFLITNRGLGKELCDLLRKTLALPEGVQSFSVHFGVSEVVRVDCTYAPHVLDEPLPARIES